MMTTTHRWTYGVLDAYTDEYATEREFGTFEEAVAWAKGRDLDPAQFAIAMWDDCHEQLRLLAIPQ